MIYYTHINEDNLVERKILNSGFYEDLFCVSGSGERLIALLDHQSLKRVHVIDNNREALYLTQLKLAALQTCSVEAYLDFIGLSGSKLDRIELFEKIKFRLNEDCIQFWQKNLKYIRKGILHMGHFEKFLSNFRPFLKIYLGSSFYQCFSTPINECISFPHKRWSLIRWFFSQRWVYLLAGNKDVAFISKDGQQKLIPEALQQALRDDSVSQNCLFHLIFNGNLNMMPEKQMPPSFQYEVLTQVKELLQEGRIKIKYYNQDVLAFGKRFDFNQCGNSFFSFSDILSFDNLEYIKKLFKTIKDKSVSSSVLILRAFIRNRMSENQIRELKNEFGPVKDLSHLENTKMYQVCEINLEK